MIATGARSAVPPLTGLSDIDYLTSTSAMEMEELPGSLLILGGGIIALEFSQLFVRLGVEVTIIQRPPGDNHFAACRYAKQSGNNGNIANRLLSISFDNM